MARELTNYTKGRAGEYEVKRLLESEGFVVFRTAGSHSPADLIALSISAFYANSAVIVAQVKIGKQPSKKTIEEFKAWEIVGEKRFYWRRDRGEWVRLV